MLRGSLAPLASFLLSAPMWAAPGDLDTSYDGDGIAVINLTEKPDSLYGMALQKDGKLVCVGGAALPYGALAVVRFNLDGSPDTTFSDDGKVIMAVTSSNSAGEDVVILPDGKIVVCGYAHTGTNNDFFVVRYNPDGTVDPSFGNGGTVLTPVSAGNDYAYGMALQPDGKILVVGGANNEFGVVRYLPSGALDGSFGTDGKVITRLSADVDSGAQPLVQGDGKIVVVGMSKNNGSFDFAAVRYNTDGSLDSSFGTGGKVITPVGDTNLYLSAHHAVLEPDERILAIGGAMNGTNSNFAVVRWGTDGSLDSTFGDDGILMFSVGDSGCIGRSVAVQGDGKILLAGAMRVGFSYTAVLARLNADGSADASFNGGYVLASPGPLFSSTYGELVAIQCDGRILVGMGVNVGLDGKFVVFRYQNDWVPPPDIMVQEISGIELAQGDGPEFEYVRMGKNRNWTFIVRNSGGTNLSDLTASIAGQNADDFSVSTPSLTSLAPYATNTWVVTFAPGACGDRGATLHINSNDPDENPFDITLHGTGISALEAWRMVHFGCITNQGIGADVFDCEKDGIPNLMEFALNSDPRQYGPCPTTLITSVPGFLYYIYDRNKDAVGELTFVVEWSDTLLPNDWHTDGVSEFVIPGGNESSDLIEAIIPAGPGPARFVRLRVIRP